MPTEYLARQGVEHDDMNILCIGSKIVDHNIIENIIDEFLNAKFSQMKNILEG